MVRPKNRRERRQRNAIAADLHTGKYHQRVIEPYKRMKRKWDDIEEQDIQGLEDDPRFGSDDPLSPEFIDNQ